MSPWSHEATTPRLHRLDPTPELLEQPEQHLVVGQRCEPGPARLVRDDADRRLERDRDAVDL
jgi:hypothetical protein